MKPSGALHRSIPAAVSGSVGNMTISVNVPTPSPKYIDELIRSRCFPDLLATGWYPDAKELTESAAAFRASKKLQLAWDDPDVCVIAVGDGRWPRTAAMFAFRTRWTTIAVDPRAAINGEVPGVRRCYSIPKTLGDCTSPWDYCGLPLFQHYVFACVHSHAPTAELLDSMEGAPGDVHVISNRCCYDDSLDQDPSYEYLDWGIWSPERRVRVWPFYHSAAW